MRSLLKVGLAAMLALAAVTACDEQGTRRARDEDFDQDEYVEEEFDDVFDIERNAGTPPTRVQSE